MLRFLVVVSYQAAAKEPIHKSLVNRSDLGVDVRMFNSTRLLVFDDPELAIVSRH